MFSAIFRAKQKTEEPFAFKKKAASILNSNFFHSTGREKIVHLKLENKLFQRKLNKIKQIKL